MSESQEQNPFAGVKRRQPGKSTGRGAVIVALLCLVAVGVSFTPLPGKIKRGLREIVAPKGPTGHSDEELEQMLRREGDRIRAEKDAEAEKEISDLRREFEKTRQVPQKTDGPSVAPNQTIPESSLSPEVDIRQLRADVPFKVEVKIDHGGLASKERKLADSYSALYTLSVRLPAPALTLQDLQNSNPKLGAILPGLGEVLSKGVVSPWYATLYDNKTTRLKRDATALDELLTRHNLFDCETILNLKSANGRRALLLQADMDVVSDGSDGDRLPTMPDEVTKSANYQPFTSYFWNKKTQVPNPLIAGYEARIAAGEKEAADRSTTAERKKWLKSRMDTLRRGISDMKAHSYLIAEYDPFIVVPGNILRTSDPFSPNIGDYALVIYGDKVLPAVVGDSGPSYKVGEASLRIAKELSSRATPNNRPVSDLKVTYLIFPGSREGTLNAPDYDVWRTKCEELVKDFGGLGPDYKLLAWTNLLAPPAPPTPPTPVPGSTPTSGQPGVTPQGPSLNPTPQPPAPTAPVGPGTPVPPVIAPK